MNAFEQPRNETPGANPPPPAFNDAVYEDIFNSAPMPTAEQVAANAERKRLMEESFAGDNPEIQKMDARKANSERIARDAEAIKKLSEEIKRAA